MVAFAVGGTLLIVLTLRFGVIGTAIASAITSGTYLALMVLTIRTLPQTPPNAPISHGI